jgi:hypothetical protein
MSRAEFSARLCAGESETGDAIMDSGEETSGGPAELAGRLTRCPHCGYTSDDPERVAKCRELCEQIRQQMATRPADPQEQEPPRMDGDLRPRPMRARAVEPAADAPLSIMPAMDPKFIKWARQGFRVVHEHTHKDDPAKDANVVILILAR